MDDTIILTKQEVTDDEIGQKTLCDIKRIEIFVTVKSINRNEFFSAGQNGISPDFLFETSKLNYAGEKEVEYKGQRYSVYRTYSPHESDMIELYVTSKAGV